MIAVFTSLIVASDYALAPIINVKLVDTLVFATGFVFGFRIGAYVAVTSELVWGIVSPFGFGGYIIPFLVVGEILYALAGYLASKVWGMGTKTSLEENWQGKARAFSQENFFFGAIIAVCAFLWDIETNLATGLIATWPSPSVYSLTYVVTGIPFMIPHELADFVIGTSLAPIAITFFLRVRNSRPFLDKEKAGYLAGQPIKV